MKIGITGGAGFIGGHVADYCLAHGHIPVIFDRRGRSNTATAAEVFLGDVVDPIAVAELAAHVDGIIHLAACLGTQETIQNPRPSAATNILGGLNVLDAAVGYDIPMVYIGVGNWWMENSYSISKHTIERYIRMYVKERSLRCNVVRAVNAYGPRQSVAPPFGPAKVRKITPAFVCRALTGQAIEVYGDGEQISDMVHVRDVARVLVEALRFAKSNVVIPDALEVGPLPDDSRTVNQVANAIRSIVSKRGVEQPALRHVPMRPGETPGDRVTANPNTLKQIGIDPSSLIPLHRGLDETVEWFATHWLPGYLQQLEAMENADTVDQVLVG